LWETFTHFLKTFLMQGNAIGSVSIENKAN